MLCANLHLLDGRRVLSNNNQVHFYWVGVLAHILIGECVLDWVVCAHNRNNFDRHNFDGNIPICLRYNGGSAVPIGMPFIADLPSRDDHGHPEVV